jgi:hypothetical protein
MKTSHHVGLWIVGGLAAWWGVSKTRAYLRQSAGDEGKAMWTKSAGDPLLHLSPGNFKRFIAVKQYLDAQPNAYQTIRDVRTHQQSKQTGGGNIFDWNSTPVNYPLSVEEQALVYSDNDIASVIASSTDDAWNPSDSNDPLGIKYAKDSYAKAASPLVQGALKAADAARVVFK